MKKLLSMLLALALINTMAFAAKALDEENITKMLDEVKIAKEHKSVKSLKRHFLSNASISLTDQNIDDSKTTRLTFAQYKRYLSKRWKSVQENLIEIKERKFDISADKRSALVKTTLVQTQEIAGVKTETTIYETIGVKLIKGKIYINYYSSRTMLNTAMRVN